MLLSIGTTLVILGIFVSCVGAPLAIALYAFTGNPIQGIPCFIVPLYVCVYANKHKVGVWLMRGW